LRNLAIVVEIYVSALRRKNGNPQAGGAGSSSYDVVNVLFNSLESLQQYSRQLLHTLLIHLQEVDFCGLKLQIGNIYTQSTIIPVSQMYQQFYTNAMSVDALQRAKTETDVALFKVRKNSTLKLKCGLWWTNYSFSNAGMWR